MLEETRTCDNYTPAQESSLPKTVFPLSQLNLNGRKSANVMFAIILSLLCSIRQGFRTRAAIQAEIFALRHQLLVLQRSTRAHKCSTMHLTGPAVRLTASDRLLWVWLSRLWREWRSALVKPETVIAWHRRGFRLYWSSKSRHPQGNSRSLSSPRSRVTVTSLGKSLGAFVKWVP